MDGANGNTGATASTGKPTRGKDQLNWTDDVWKMIDTAVNEELARSAMAHKFLPSVYVHKKRTTIDSDIVVIPAAGSADMSLSVEENVTTRVQQFNVATRMSRAQVEAEGEIDADLSSQMAAKPAQAAATPAPATMSRPHQASTAVSLVLQATKLQSQVVDLVSFCGTLAVAYHPVFVSGLVQALDPQLLANLGGGLFSVLPSTSATQFQPLPASTTPATAAALTVANVIQLPAAQVVVVHPTIPATAGAPPRYAENGLNGLAAAVGAASSNGYNDNYCYVGHTYPYIEMHEALSNTLIQPVEPISSMITTILGSPNMPPFAASASADSPPGVPSPAAGMPTHILTPTSANPNAITAINAAGGLPGFAPATQVLYTAFLVSLSGNSMDFVRGLMDDGQDICMTYVQKTAQEQFLFNISQRFTLRLKDPLAVVLILYVDQ